MDDFIQLFHVDVKTEEERAQNSDPHNELWAEPLLY